ncbi:MAG: 3'(2'),5'-bisphosphate nucleotidase [Planctomycetota bacterium]|nr:3'(2'),5'-bisphosphate nucleotidase [Planctomycetota bacterium]
MPDYAKYVEAARFAVASACVVCKQVQRSLEQVRAITKDDASPVTIADYASQAVIAHALRERLGTVALVAEEASAFLRRDDNQFYRDATLAAVREMWPDADENQMLDAIDVGAADPVDHASGFWTLDPIDGTKGFLRGDQYCVALAYVEHGRPTIGVLGCPNLPSSFSDPLDVPDSHGTIYFTVAGEGLYQIHADHASEKPTHIRRLDHVPGEPVVMCESVESAHSDQSASSRVLARVGKTAPPVRIDSQCKYAVVARGQADAYLRLPTKRGYVERIWDHAAGAIIAAEAGCAVSDMDGKPLDFSRGRGLEDNRGIVCASTTLHGRVLGAIRELGL